MTPQDLKNSILQLAIQGKLVEQRPEEGSAEDLFRQIQAEKRSLAKAGKIKKSKPLSEIGEGEMPFDIPENWKWVRLGELLRVIGGISYDKKDVASCGYRILRGGNIQNMKVLLAEDDVFLPSQYKDDDKIVQVGDILVVASTGSKAVIGKAGFVDRPIPDTMPGAFLRICRAFSVGLASYLRVIFESDFYRKHIRDLSQGTNINNVKESYITQFVIPLPPLPEQKRIFAKIEELQPLIDRYTEAWTKLETFNKRFPGDMQKSLLQLAIQGKLVEQRPEEGTGEELYRKILATKKSKKEKPLPPITDDEIPFDIPESWKWYRIGELFKIVNGFTPLKTNPEFWANGDIPWFTIEDVHRQGRFITSTEKFITRRALAKGTERIVPADTVLLCCTASVGEYAYAKIPLTTNQQFNAFVVKPHCQSAVYPLYVFEFVKTLKGNLIDRAGKTTFNFVSVGKLSNMLIPLPPLAEQKRIVAKLEELLPLCERLK